MPQKAVYPSSQPVVGLADPVINLHNICMSSVGTTTVACSSEDPGQSEGINTLISSYIETVLSMRTCVLQH